MVPRRNEAEDLMQVINEIVADQGDEEVDALMLTAQEYFHQDDDSRLHATQNRPASSQPASRCLFDLARPKGARIVFAEELPRKK